MLALLHTDSARIKSRKSHHVTFKQKCFSFFRFIYFVCCQENKRYRPNAIKCGMRYTHISRIYFNIKSIKLLFTLVADLYFYTTHIVEFCFPL